MIVLRFLDGDSVTLETVRPERVLDRALVAFAMFKHLKPVSVTITVGGLAWTWAA